MRRQYRLTTETNWQSSFGMAILAFINESGSGRKLTFKSLEVQPQSDNGTPTFVNAIKCISATGEDMSKYVTPFNSAISLPSNIKLTRNSNVDSESTVLKVLSVKRLASTAGTHNTLFGQRDSGLSGGSHYGGRVATGLEDIIINNNETFALVPRQPVSHNSPMRVSLTFKASTGFYSTTFVCFPKPGLSMLALENDSGAAISISSIGVTEVGTTDTPYLRVIPVGQIKSEFFGNSGMQIQEKLLKMDSSYPDLPYLTIYTDVDMVPLGVPESYLTQGSAGSPKGLNYIHTKDFDGPTFRAYFPEIRGAGLSATPDDRHFTFSMKGADLGVGSSGICINPGEGLAIVASAETAVAVQASFSGWPALIFSAQLEDSPVNDPVLTISNVVSGSDIVIIQSGTANILASVDELVGSNWSWGYDPDIVSNIDIAIYKAGYMPFSFANLVLGTSNVSLPVSQSVDPSYLV